MPPGNLQILKTNTEKRTMPSDCNQVLKTEGKNPIKDLYVRLSTQSDMYLLIAKSF